MYTRGWVCVFVFSCVCVGLRAGVSGCTYARLSVRVCACECATERLCVQGSAFVRSCLRILYIGLYFRGCVSMTRI